jgi:hypothetical protein
VKHLHVELLSRFQIDKPHVGRVAASAIAAALHAHFGAGDPPLNLSVSLLLAKSGVGTPYTHIVNGNAFSRAHPGGLCPTHCRG